MPRDRHLSLKIVYLIIVLLEVKRRLASLQPVLLTLEDGFKFFKDDLVLLDSFESSIRCALNGFAAGCDIAEMKISTFNTEVLRLSKNLTNVFWRLAEYH